MTREGLGYIEGAPLEISRAEDRLCPTLC
jgi:hypothetical protein